MRVWTKQNKKALFIPNRVGSGAHREGRSSLFQERICSKKYMESAKIFTSAYDWFVKEASRLVAIPEEGEYPYWAFRDLHNVDNSGKGVLLKLDCPWKK